MTITFRYKSVRRPDGSLVKSPSIPVVLDLKEKFETLALLDSGADISAIPKNIAEILGINLNKEKTFSYGLGGKVETIKTFVNLTLEKDHERYTLCIPVSIVLNDYDFPVLLGREGFFNEFSITFNESEERISLKKVNKKHVM